jgi:hypothetical protein
MPAREDDQSYFERRARDCRNKAELAGDPSVQQTHLQFATVYERRARAEAKRPSVDA